MARGSGAFRHARDGFRASATSCQKTWSCCWLLLAQAVQHKSRLLVACCMSFGEGGYCCEAVGLKLDYVVPCASVTGVHFPSKPDSILQVPYSAYCSMKLSMLKPHPMGFFSNAASPAGWP